MIIINNISAYLFLFRWRYDFNILTRIFCIRHVDLNYYFNNVCIYIHFYQSRQQTMSAHHLSYFIFSNDKFTFFIIKIIELFIQQK